MAHVNANFMPVGDRVKTTKEGRVCKFKGCKVVLSIYNYENAVFIPDPKL